MSGIKGSAIESVVVDVLRLVEDGRMSRDELEARLEPEDLEILDQKVLGALWYALPTWGRLTELLLEVEGKGDVAYLVERGRAAADRLKSSGVYAQLQGDRETWGSRMGAMLATIGPAMYKDSQWAYQPGETIQHFQVVAQVPDEFPDVGVYPIQGFVEYVANTHTGLGVRVRVRRDAATKLVMEGTPA